jgi:hypothetical protein
MSKHNKNHSDKKPKQRFPRLASPGDWPTLSDEALQGLAGEVVKLISPQSESDPAALLIQFLSFFGNAIGPKPFYPVEATKHHTNLFAVIVGQTSRARKGTSFDNIRAIFAGTRWSESCFVTGLSSGEGLIWIVRDGNAKTVSEVRDKRVFVHEPEFSRVLRVQRRDGNTLSPTLRAAWDGTKMQIATKNDPVKATGAHISVVGHITQDELRRELYMTEQANGYANRFLFVCARRSNLLPEGGHVDGEKFANLAKRVDKARKFARNADQLKRSESARRIWSDWYKRRGEFPGMLEAISCRAEAQVLRLSMIYALLDRSTIIRERHLRAALAVWSYCEASARYIFRTRVGDKTADRIYEALLRVGKDGLTKNEIRREIFSANLSKEETDQALEILARNHLAESVKQETDGRPSERWRALGV